jgi:hypothetical protein
VVEQEANHVGLVQIAGVFQSAGVYGFIGDLRRGVFCAAIALRGDSHHENRFAVGLHLGAALHEELEGREIARGRGLEQRRGLHLRVVRGIGIGAVIEQQLDDGLAAGLARGDHERRAKVGGAGVDVRAVRDEQRGLVVVVRGPHQGGGVGVVVRVGIGAHLQQPVQRWSVGVEHRVHEGRRTFGAAFVQQCRLGRDGLEKVRQRIVAQHLHGCDGLGVEGRKIDFVGQRRRPHRALIDPVFEDGDLVGTQRLFGRHRRAELRVAYTVIHHAVGAVAGHNAA